MNARQRARAYGTLSLLGGVALGDNAARYHWPSLVQLAVIVVAVIVVVAFAERWVAKEGRR